MTGKTLKALGYTEGKILGLALEILKDNFKDVETNEVQKLLKKVMAQKSGAPKTPIKTWARRSEIPPEFVGHTFMVHNGRHHITVKVNEAMVGHRLGEFAPTRTFRGHSGNKTTTVDRSANRFCRRPPR